MSNAYITLDGAILWGFVVNTLKYPSQHPAYIYPFSSTAIDQIDDGHCSVCTTASFFHTLIDLSSPAEKYAPKPEDFTVNINAECWPTKWLIYSNSAVHSFRV